MRIESLSIDLLYARQTINDPVSVNTHWDTSPSQELSITGEPASEVGGAERQSPVPFIWTRKSPTLDIKEVINDLGITEQEVTRQQRNKSIET